MFRWILVLSVPIASYPVSGQCWEVWLPLFCCCFVPLYPVSTHIDIPWASSSGWTVPSQKPHRRGWLTAVSLYCELGSPELDPALLLSHKPWEEVEGSPLLVYCPVQQLRMQLRRLLAFFAVRACYLHMVNMWKDTRVLLCQTAF